MKTEYHAFHAGSSADAGPALRVLSYNIQLGIAYTRYHHYLTRSWRHVLPFEGRQNNLDSIARFLDGFAGTGAVGLEALSIRWSILRSGRASQTGTRRPTVT
jgi:hypothetical protein